MASNGIKCNFCGECGSRVKRFISGPNVYICNWCVSVSVTILMEDGNFGAKCPSHILKFMGIGPLEVEDLQLVDQAGFDSQEFLKPFLEEKKSLKDLLGLLGASVTRLLGDALEAKIGETEGELTKLVDEHATILEIRNSQDKLREKLKALKS